MEWWQEEPFEPAGSVWRVIEENSKENERIEIREILGESLVEEVQELHREVYQCLIDLCSVQIFLIIQHFHDLTLALREDSEVDFVMRNHRKLNRPAVLYTSTSGLG